MPKIYYQQGKVEHIYSSKACILEIIRSDATICLRLNKNGQGVIKKYQLNIENLQSIKNLSTYFDSIQDFIQYIKIQGNLIVNQNSAKIQIIGKHPTKQTETYKIAQIQLLNKEKQKNNDLNKLTELYFNNQQLTPTQIKSILISLTQQISYLQNKQKPTKQQNISKISDKLIQSKQQIIDQCIIQTQNNEQINLNEKVTKQMLYQQVDIVKEMMMNKISKVVQQIQKVRQILSKQIQEIVDKIVQQNESNQNKFVGHNLNNQNRYQNYSPYPMPPFIPPQIPQMGMPLPPSLPIYQNFPIDKNNENVVKKQIISPINANSLNKTINSTSSTKIIKQQQPKINYYQNLPAGYTKIKDIQPGQQKIIVYAKVLSVKPSKNPKKLQVVLGDQTGIVNAYLNNSSVIKVNNIIIIHNGYAHVRQQHIQLQLNNKNGSVNAYKKQINTVNMKFNLSEKAWVVQQ